MIAVIDYGRGNLGSVEKALGHLGMRAVVTQDPRVIADARALVLPGDGAFHDAMANLQTLGLLAPLRRALDGTRPFLGICLGLQMLFDRSEEGPTAGLGMLAGEVVRFRADGMTSPTGNKLKVPHMGWSPVRQTRAHPLWAGIPDGSRFYFAHSFHPVPADPALTAGSTEYPSPFTCAIARANIFATQFHPEKSHRAGLQLLANFVAWDGQS